MSSPSFEIRNTIVRAGAGAGKTTELVARVLHAADEFKKQQGRFPRLIITTFTRKATQELKERLLKKALKEKRKDLEDFLKRPSHVHISTIHGVLSSFLSRFGSKIGLTPKFDIMSLSQEHKLEKQVLRELLKQEMFRNYFSDLQEVARGNDILKSFREYFRLWCENSELHSATENDFSLIAEEHWKDFLLLCLQLEQNIRQDTDHVKWLELAQFLNHFVTQFKGKTFCESCLQAIKILEETPSPQNRGNVISETTKDLRDSWKKSIEQFQGYSYQTQYWSEHTKLAEKFEIVAQLFNQEMIKEKIFAGQISMSDLENFSLILLKTTPDVGGLFAEEWDYWLIDEYQDTAPRQVYLLDKLIGSRPKFLVGDPQQSIYLFRGARSEVFNQAESWMIQNQGLQLQKNINYRSKPALLYFFNDFFSSLGAQFKKMEPDLNKSLDKPLNKAIVAEFLYANEETPEIIATLSRIQELLQNKVNLGDICVLSRNNKSLEELAEEAEKRGVPIQVHAASKFYERQEVIDAMNLLKFMVNPHDNLVFVQLLRSPWFPLEDNDILKFCHSEAESFWRRSQEFDFEVITQLQEILNKTQQFGFGETWFNAMVESGFFDWSLQIDPTGRREANLWKLVSQVRLLERKPGFSYLDFVQSKDFQFLDLESAGENDAIPVMEPSRVHLMTIHASKGLQFKHVILIGCGDYRPQFETSFFMAEDLSKLSNKWTLNLTDSDEGKRTASLLMERIKKERMKRDLDEYDRLLYVALTRAEETVTLVASDKNSSESWASRWASKFSLNQNEGKHETELYTYSVKKNNFSVHSKILEEPKISSAKEKLQKLFSKKSQVFSVTELLSLKEKSFNPENKIPKKINLEDVQKATRGTEVHAIFESLKYASDLSDLLPTDFLPKEWISAVNYVLNFENGLLRQIIKNGEVEWGFGIRLGPHLLQGQVDLWGKDDQGCLWVVDYKTGSPSYLEKAFQQLVIYRYALQFMNKISDGQEVQLMVVYPFSNLIEVREAPTFKESELFIKSFNLLEVSN